MKTGLLIDVSMRKWPAYRIVSIVGTTKSKKVDFDSAEGY